MDSHIDHYAVLGLPVGIEGAKLSEKEISKAYRSKALELHPDKRPDDPDAHANFQKLKTSYEILKDDKARKLFDDLVRVKHDKLERQSQHDAKRRRMMSDLEARERSAFQADYDAGARDEEERISKKLKDEISRIRAMHASKATPPLKKETVATGGKEGTQALDKGKVLKVSWEKFGVDYTALRLRELFGEFGDVEDVVIKSSKKRGSALVVMASKDAAASVVGNVLGDLSNPLLVVPLVPVNPPPPTTPPLFYGAADNVDPEGSQVNSHLVGAGYQAFEDSVLEKLKKAAQRQK